MCVCVPIEVSLTGLMLVYASKAPLLDKVYGSKLQGLTKNLKVRKQLYASVIVCACTSENCMQWH